MINNCNWLRCGDYIKVNKRGASRLVTRASYHFTWTTQKMSGVFSRVTDDLIGKVLRRDVGSDATLVSWSLEDFTNQTDGTMSDIQNARVKYTLGGHPQEVGYVLKVNPNKGKANEGFLGKMHANECNFYGDVIPALNEVLEGVGCAPLSFPKGHYHNIDKGVDLLIMENLREKGFKMKSKDIGTDVAHATLVLKELARFHAASTLLQARTPDEDLADRFDCLKKDWSKEFDVDTDFGGYIDRYMDIGIAMFEKIGGCEKVINWIKKIRPDAWKMHDEQIVRTPPFAVITHGDCWINNFLFRYDSSNNPVEVKFLDFQCCRKASLALDLQHFLTMNLTGPERRPTLPSFLTTYHTAFDDVMKAGGSKVPFTYEELRQEYIDRGFYGVLFSIMWLPNMVRRPEDSMDIIDEKTGAKLSEKENVLKMVDDNPMLIPRVMSVVDEWTEFGLIV